MNISGFPISKTSILTQAQESSSTAFISVTSVFLFYLWTVVHALLVFKQFSFFEIFSVSVFFMLILFGFTWIFTRDIFQKKYEINVSNLLIVIVALVFMILLANTPSSIYLNYYRAFPYQEIDLGLGWHQDTAFHVSIIQNILNSGYPSIGQHDSPLIVYHILSHYVDSLGLLLTNLDPLDSYTLFFHFKVFLFISSVLLLVGSTLKSSPPLISTFASFILAPLVINSWYPIGSHGSWFISILIIFSVQKVFKIITLGSRPKNKDYVFLFFLIVLISIGKVSTGFMYAVFIGLALLFLHPKDYRVYSVGILWSIFFIAFMNAMTGSGGSSSLYVPNIFDIGEVTHRIKFYSSFTGTQVLQVLLSASILFLLAYLYRIKSILLMALSSIASVTVFFIITQLYTGFSRAVILFFSIGLSYVVTLFLFQTLAHVLNERQSAYLDTCKDQSKIKKISLIAVIVAMTFIFTKPSFNLFNINNEQLLTSLNNIHLSSFERLNTKLPSDEKVTLKRLLSGKADINHLPRPKHSLGLFKESLEKYTHSNNLKKDNTLLFVPKDIFKSDMPKLKGHLWASGLLIYASTGFPLVHGIQKIRNDYGYADYGKDALRVSLKDFNPEVACQFSKNIVVTKSFSPPSFFHFDCGQSALYQTKNYE